MKFRLGKRPTPAPPRAKAEWCEKCGKKNPIRRYDLNKKKVHCRCSSLSCWHFWSTDLPEGEL